MKRGCYLTVFGVVVLAVVIPASGGEQVSLVLADGGIQFSDGAVQTAAAPTGSAPVEDTGLTECFDTVGDPRDCSGTGEDGEFQAGAAWPTPRFTDNGGGTVTDNLTGLMWLKDANCPAGAKTWQLALDWVADLNTTAIACTDYTALTFTDWRLANIKELLSLVDRTQFVPALPPGHPFVNVQTTSTYWSSSSKAGQLSWASLLVVPLGNHNATDKTNELFVWPVRGSGSSSPAQSASLVLADGGIQFPDGSVQATAASGGAPVENTALTECFDTAGDPRDCSGTGEDGEFQAGVSWPTLRFTDNEDGTVTDNLTGLMWLKDADCPAGAKTWQLALDWVGDLNTTATACTDYTALTFTDWRLANIKELLSLVDFTQSTPALPLGHPFVNVQTISIYWSSSSRASDPAAAFHLAMSSGNQNPVNKTNSRHVWPVRAGQ